MKKRLLVFGFAFTAMLALSSCEFYLPFFGGNSSDPYSYKTEQPSSSDEQSSFNEDVSTSSLDSSESSTSGSAQSFDSSTPSSTSSSQTSTPSSTSSSQSSIPSSTSSMASSISSTSSTTSQNTEPPITANNAAITYKDIALHNTSISSTPSVGEANLLVIPVWFTNSGSYITTSSRENVREDIRKAYFGTNNETGWRSVKTYYEEESHGTLTMNGTVSSWYECGKKYSEYGTDNNSVDKTRALVKSATNWYFTQNASESRQTYDKDGDGYLDGVMLIYAAPDQQAANSSYDNLWAYCYWIQETSQKNVSNPGVNAFFWASYDFMYGQNKVMSRTGVSGPHNGDTNHCSVDAHTFIHEMGHMYGLDDYYDYSQQYNPAGGFSMQDYNVAGHDPFSSFALGWGKAYIPTESVTINLKPFATSGEMILLTPSFNSYDSPFDEYMLLEFYTPTGLNAFDTTYQYDNRYPKGSQEIGIRLWHVDARLFYYNSESYPNPASVTFTTKPNIRNHAIYSAFTNTYYKQNDSSNAYLSPLGEANSEYYNFNALQLIRNNPSANYKPSDDFNTNSLFRMGSSFNMNTFKNQFVKTGKLNKNIDLGFSFTVNNTIAEYATITITKL